MMFCRSNSNLCLGLVVVMVVVGVSSAKRYKEIFVARNSAPATSFRPDALRFQDVTKDLYNSYFPDTGLFVVPLGKSGNFSFLSSYLIQPQAHHVVYTFNGEVLDEGERTTYHSQGDWDYSGFGAQILDESKGATYYSQGDWETYEIFDVYMESGDYATMGYYPGSAEYSLPPAFIANYVTFRGRRQED